MIVAVALALLAWGGENRLWFVELEARGTCEEIRLDCGSDGETRLLGPFSAGDGQRMRLPVPVRSPLGYPGLTGLPLPRGEAWPPGTSATVVVLGWSERQPSERLARAAGTLMSRPRPPVPQRTPRAAAPELALAGVGGGFLLWLRRRNPRAWGVGLGVGLAIAVSAGQLGRVRRPPLQGERVVEWEPERDTAVVVDVAMGELPLSREWLEVSPESTRIELHLSSPLAGLARATGARLVGIEGRPTPSLRAERNEAESLTEVWTRSANGAWEARGPWPAGVPLPEAPDPPLSEAPPGWLAGGLPPGRSVLLARGPNGGWLRCLGFKMN